MNASDPLYWDVGLQRVLEQVEKSVKEKDARDAREKQLRSQRSPSKKDIPSRNSRTDITTFQNSISNIDAQRDSEANEASVLRAESP